VSSIGHAEHGQLVRDQLTEHALDIRGLINHGHAAEQPPQNERGTELSASFVEKGSNFGAGVQKITAFDGQRLLDAVFHVELTR
jgi:hypothetical protein